MKQILFFIFALLTATYLQGQRLEQVNLPAPSEVAREYRPTYRKLLRENAEQNKQNEGRDIVLPPEAQVPTLIQQFSTAAQANWGEQLLAAGDIRKRILDECRFRVVIKITDTGGKLLHVDLLSGQLPGISYTGEATLEDANGHATHCAGIIAGKEIGLASQLVGKGLLQFKPVKILSDAGSGSFTWVANAYASERANDIALIKAGTAVIYSGSFGGGTAIVPAVETEIEKSVKEGVLFVFANGNTAGAVNYPAMSPYAISTASLDQSMAVSSYSSRGPQTDQAMPGRNINSTYKENTYATLSGTSMATPFLAAATAIAISKWGMSSFPNPDAMKAYLRKCATDIPPAGFDDPSGWGVVFIRAILDTPPGGTPPPPPPPPVDPPAPVVQVVTNITTGYAIRYRFAGQVENNLLHIRKVTMYADGRTAEESIDNSRKACALFFPAHVIAEIPAKDGLQGAGYWAGQFLEYYGKNNALPVQVESMEVADETGRSFIVTGFDKAEVPESYETGKVRLLTIKNN